MRSPLIRMRPRVAQAVHSADELAFVHKFLLCDTNDNSVAINKRESQRTSDVDVGEDALLLDALVVDAARELEVAVLTPVLTCRKSDSTCGNCQRTARSPHELRTCQYLRPSGVSPQPTSSTTWLTFTAVSRQTEQARFECEQSSRCD